MSLLCLPKTSMCLRGWELYFLIVLFPMLIFLATFLPTLSSIFRSRAALELENLALRHQIGVLQRAATKRPKLTRGDRLLWVCLSRLWRDWAEFLRQSDSDGEGWHWVVSGIHCYRGGQTRSFAIVIWVSDVLVWTCLLHHGRAPGYV